MVIDGTVRDQAVAKALDDLIGETEMIVEYFRENGRHSDQAMVDTIRYQGHLHIKEVLVPQVVAVWEAAGGDAERLRAILETDAYFTSDPF